ncbi:phosphohexosemutase [Helicobacter fennelliae]|uniref:Phosphomannomutase n=3 Tax=Helicobacter TaxID=209 RepID=T1D378_9HELI|nr:phosphomannomutase [Helicobacter fennelliae MRY12-0050]SQB98579.1 phosphohexosemutase [Helicobacter fennelliae]STP07925.1 phosphohexosemutase [Helicobacter fennelliae]STQ84168.1 phosphohexosemutase [Helicobacter fennelliae]
MDMSIFREYDIRGIYNQNLVQSSVFKIGFLLGKKIKANKQDSVAIGYDARVHSPVLFEWLKNGFLHSGCEVHFIGMIPTPVAYFATFQEDIKNSVMITGSHNPPEYNGFKITLNQEPFYGEMIRQLGKELAGLDIEYVCSDKKVHTLNALGLYQDYFVSHFKHLKNFPYEVVFDYGNGVGAIALEEILDRLNIKHISLFEDPDGTFPNHHPDPSEEKNLKDLKDSLTSHKLQIGIAFDGDADRIALVTPNHSYKGDELAILFARNIAKTIAKPIIIGEVKCSQAMYDEIDKIGQSVMYKTGHSNLKVKLKELHAHLAAEMSGHLFFNDRYFGYDDALYAALRVLELFLDSTPQELEQQIRVLPHYFSTPEEKIHTTEDKKFTQIENLKQKLNNPPKDFPPIKKLIDIDGIRIVFEDGWGLVRASNTTPVLVTRFEATTEEKLNLYKTKILQILQDS